MIISGFFRCKCNKMHCANGVSVISVCACGQRLWPILLSAYYRGR